MVTSLAEPAVLAAAKDALYPDIDSSPGRYAVTDTQFAQSTWGDWTVPSAIHDRLRPFNAVRLRNGRPDLLAVGLPEADVLDADAASDPVVVVEAKGETATPEASVLTGIEQAYSRLPEVNLGFVAAPLGSVTETARSLARELNVGLVGVDADETVAVLEPARVGGAGRFSRGIEALRFEARSHRLTAGSFPVNHPKNFLGYALALASEADTAEVYREKVIRAVSGGRRGAILLGLVDESGGRERLTPLGEEIVRFAIREHGSISAALEAFDSWTRKATRFTDVAPRWAQLARSVTVAYEPTQLVVEALEGLHRDGVRTARLPQVFERASGVNLPLAVEVFVTQDHREDVLTDDGELDRGRLDDPSVYKSGAYFQFKAQLYHVGLLTVGGTDDADTAMEAEWRLEEPVG